MQYSVIPIKTAPTARIKIVLPQNLWLKSKNNEFIQRQFSYYTLAYKLYEHLHLILEIKN